LAALESDHYRTVRARAQASIKVERSEFIGIVFPISGEDSFFSILESISREYHDATHHCWAFRMRVGSEMRSRSSDAGEPSGSAGRPILSALEGEELADSGAVVVRYYGGVKLGTGGLGRAYRAAAQEALHAADFEDRYIYERVQARAPFNAVGALYRLVDPPHVLLVEEHYEDDGHRMVLDVRLSRAAELRRILEEKRLLA
jgi:uncharacterized YigZ family protein